MLFVWFMKPKPSSTAAERTRRRLDWSYPQGVRVIAEYWLASPESKVIVVCEGDDALTMIHAAGEWDDLFETTVVPAITAEAGLAHAREVHATAVA